MTAAAEDLLRRMRDRSLGMLRQMRNRELDAYDRRIRDLYQPPCPIEFEDRTTPEYDEIVREVAQAVRWIREQRAAGLLPS